MKKTLKNVSGIFLYTMILIGCVNQSFAYTHEINPIVRETGSGTRDAFNELFDIDLKYADGRKTDQTSIEATQVNKTGIMLMSVMNNKNAIGYVSMGSLSDQVKTLAVDGVQATPENISQGIYTIYRPFNIAMARELDELTQDFINYILSKEGQRVVALDYIAIDATIDYESKKPSGKITIAGSSSVSPLMYHLMETYQSTNPNASIDLQETDSTSGITSVKNGSAQIAMVSRELKESERNQLDSKVIALDGIVMIVNKDNPLTNLTKEQIKSIFIGEVSRWEDINHLQDK